MYIVNQKIGKKEVAVSGQSVGQVKRKLCQMGIDFTKVNIEYVEDDICPVCGSVLVVDKKSGKLVSKSGSCFFCKGGIKL